MRILCIGYRSWALDIYKIIKKITKHKIIIQNKLNRQSVKKIKKFKPKYILFYGWSDKVPEYIIDNFYCLMLHPSALPKFRGGSPIQNQIIRNIKKSRVTIFRMSKKIDSGPILASKPVSLEGHMHEIFNRLTKIGVSLTLKILKNKFKIKEQDHKKATYFKRRKPAESEITINELKNKNSDYIINKLRMLENPYPNAFLKTKDGKKIKIRLVEI